MCLVASSMNERISNPKKAIAGFAQLMRLTLLVFVHPSDSGARGAD